LTEKDILKLPAWVFAVAFTIFVCLLIVTYVTGKSISFNPLGFVDANQQPIETTSDRAIGKWVTSIPAKSCRVVCEEEQLTAVASGLGGGGHTFFVCRQSGGQKRPGFNIDTTSDSKDLCLGETGGGRFRTDNYQCLCLNGEIE
jgi:hypothetical protein